ACAYVINTHVRSGFDRSLDHFAVLVNNATRCVENVTARSIRTVLANNESFEWLVISRRSFPSCHFDDCSGHRYRLFCGSGCLFLMCRTRLRKCHRRNKCVAGEKNNCLLDHDGLLCCCSRLRSLDAFLELAVQRSLGRIGNRVVTNRRTTFFTADSPQMQSRVRTGGVLRVPESDDGSNSFARSSAWQAFRTLSISECRSIARVRF